MSVSASQYDIRDMADEFKLPGQRVHAMTVTVYMAVGIRTGVAGSQASRLDQSATTRPENNFSKMRSSFAHMLLHKMKIKSASQTLGNCAMCILEII